MRYFQPAGIGLAAIQTSAHMPIAGQILICDRQNLLCLANERL